MNQPKENSYLVLGIDAAKFIGIGFIIIAHFDQVVSITNRISSGLTAKILERLFHVMGYYGVSLFLVASGFGLTLSLLNKQQINWKKWYLRKVTKIYILFWISYAFFLLFFSAGHKFWPAIPLTQITFKEFILTLLGIQAYFGYWGGKINAVYWFNTLIISLYAVFPLLFIFLRKFRFWKILLIFIISFIAALMAIDQSWNFFIYFFPNRIFEFSSGIMMAYFYFHRKEIFAKKIYGVLSSILVIIIFIIYFKIQGDLLTVILVLLSGPLILAALLFWLEKFFKPAALVRLFRLGAQYSHALFLFHLPFFCLYATKTLSRSEFLFVYIFFVGLTSYFGQRLANKINSYIFK